MFVARRSGSELTATIPAHGELAGLVERMLRTSGRRIDMSTPFVDAADPPWTLFSTPTCGRLVPWPLERLT